MKEAVAADDIRKELSMKKAEQVIYDSAKVGKAPAKKKDKKPNRVVRWFKDLKGELKKVTWPSAKDTAKNVGIVIVCVLLVGVLIWVFDWVVKMVVEALLNLF